MRPEQRAISHTCGGVRYAAAHLRHCERSEAIHVSIRSAMDCFAALAMTVDNERVDRFANCFGVERNRAGLSSILDLHCIQRMLGYDGVVLSDFQIHLAPSVKTWAYCRWIRQE